MQGCGAGQRAVGRGRSDTVSRTVGGRPWTEEGLRGCRVGPRSKSRLKFTLLTVNPEGQWAIKKNA